jgi:hypothetical protein
LENGDVNTLIFNSTLKAYATIAIINKRELKNLGIVYTQIYKIMQKDSVKIVIKNIENRKLKNALMKYNMKLN